VSYSRTTNTCVLVCHTVAHNPDGSITQGGVKNNGPNNPANLPRKR